MILKLSFHNPHSIWQSKLFLTMFRHHSKNLRPRFNFPGPRPANPGGLIKKCRALIELFGAYSKMLRRWFI